MTGVPGHSLLLASPRTGRMASNSSPDYKVLFQQEREARKQAEARQKQAEDRLEQTTFVEFLRYCHDVLSRPLLVGTHSSSTKGTIPLPKRKYCPTRLERWIDCAASSKISTTLSVVTSNQKKMHRAFFHLALSWTDPVNTSRGRLAVSTTFRPMSDLQWKTMPTM